MKDELLIKAYRDYARLTPKRNRLDRSVFSIRWLAEYLNLRGTHARSKGFRLGPDWSEADEAWLRPDYDKIPRPELARQMNRDPRRHLHAHKCPQPRARKPPALDA
ncbi:hypothetical protein [Novosphingobium gossypii]|uniref:hypothetical protein n=1 Tax=Novosphingobium gossypii TaxID=1604774 RepID=UPI003D20D9DA